MVVDVVITLRILLLGCLKVELVKNKLTYLIKCDLLNNYICDHTCCIYI